MPGVRSCWRGSPGPLVHLSPCPNVTSRTIGCDLAGRSILDGQVGDTGTIHGDVPGHGLMRAKADLRVAAPSRLCPAPSDRPILSRGRSGCSPHCRRPSAPAACRCAGCIARARHGRCARYAASRWTRRGVCASRKHHTHECQAMPMATSTCAAPAKRPLARGIGQGGDCPAWQDGVCCSGQPRVSSSWTGSDHRWQGASPAGRHGDEDPRTEDPACRRADPFRTGGARGGALAAVRQPAIRRC